MSLQDRSNLTLSDSYRVRNHALDLKVSDVIGDALLIASDYRRSSTPMSIHIPRQIIRDELVKLLPNQWIINYEKLHQHSRRIQSMASQMSAPDCKKDTTQRYIISFSPDGTSIISKLQTHVTDFFFILASVMFTMIVLVRQTKKMIALLSKKKKRKAHVLLPN